MPPTPTPTLMTTAKFVSSKRGMRRPSEDCIFQTNFLPYDQATDLCL